MATLPYQGALSQRVKTRRRAIDRKSLRGSSGAFTGENFPFVTEPRETNAVAFPRWVEEPSPPFARVRLTQLSPPGPWQVSARPACLLAPRAQTQLKNKIKSGCGEAGRGGDVERAAWGGPPLHLHPVFGVWP